MSDSLQPRGLYSPWNSPGQNTGVGSLSLLQGIFPTQGIEPRSPALQADSLPAEPQGKPKNTVVGSLSLLQRIFLTQVLNQGLLHCRWILYQLSYQGIESQTSVQISCSFQLCDPHHVYNLPFPCTDFLIYKAGIKVFIPLGNVYNSDM